MERFFRRKDLIYAVYQEQSISKAAKKLFISQPSLSAMIKKTEEEIGLPLFDRTCKPLRLTEAGQEYIKATEEIRHIESSFINYVASVNDLQAGALGIGSNQLLSSLVLPKYVSRFIRQYPRIRLELVDANSAELEEQMTAGRLDLVIDNTELDPTRFERKHLTTEHLLLAVPAAFSSNAAARDYRLSREDVLAGRHLGDGAACVPLDCFRDDPFILMTKDNDTRQRTRAIFQAAKLQPSAILEIDRLATLFNYIEIGAAAAIVSDTLVKHTGNQSGRVVFYKLPPRYARREIYAHYKRNRCYSKAMQVFIESLGDFS